VPKPGTEIAIAIGPPIEVPRQADETAIEAGRREVERALARLSGRARSLVAGASGGHS
jgi:hypothetical protein